MLFLVVQLWKAFTDRRAYKQLRSSKYDGHVDYTSDTSAKLIDADFDDIGTEDVTSEGVSAHGAFPDF